LPFKGINISNNILENINKQLFLKNKNTIKDDFFIINTKLSIFFNKLKYTKYYNVLSLGFLDLEKKFSRIKKKRKNNRELRR